MGELKGLSDETAKAVHAHQLSEEAIGAAKNGVFVNVPSKWPDTLTKEEAETVALLKKERKRVRSAMDNAAKRSDTVSTDAWAVVLQKLGHFSKAWHDSLHSEALQAGC